MTPELPLWAWLLAGAMPAFVFVFIWALGRAAAIADRVKPGHEDDESEAA